MRSGEGVDGEILRAQHSYQEEIQKITGGGTLEECYKAFQRADRIAAQHGFRRYFDDMPVGGKTVTLEEFAVWRSARMAPDYETAFARAERVENPRRLAEAEKARIEAIRDAPVVDLEPGRRYRSLPEDMLHSGTVEERYAAYRGAIANRTKHRKMIVFVETPMGPTGEPFTLEEFGAWEAKKMNSGYEAPETRQLIEAQRAKALAASLRDSTPEKPTLHSRAVDDSGHMLGSTLKSPGTMGKITNWFKGLFG